MPHPWQPARLRRANRVQEDRTHHGRSQAFTAPATSHPPIESIRRTQTEPPHPGQLRYFNNYIRPALGRKRARDVTYSEVAKLHRAIGARGAQVTANRATSLL